MSRPCARIPRDRRGFTLAEVLVAMVLGLMLIAATLAMLMATKRSNVALDGIARLQEAGRFALFMMEHDIRMAGYAGCAPLGEINSLLVAPTGAEQRVLYDFSMPHSGWSAAAVAGLADGALSASFDANYARGDVFVVKHAAEPARLRLAVDAEPDADRVLITPATTPPFGQLLLLSNCDGNADLFQVSNQSDNPADALYRRQVEGLIPGNRDPATTRFSTVYSTADTDLTTARSNLYYVGFGTTADGRRATETSLRRIDFGAGPGQQDQELVTGVYDLRVQYGVDTTGSGVPDVYRPVAAMTTGDWGRVVSMRVAVLAYSGDASGANAADTVTPIPFDPALWTFDEARLFRDPADAEAAPLFLPPDRRVYRFFYTTVAARAAIK